MDESSSISRRVHHRNARGDNRALKNLENTAARPKKAKQARHGAVFALGDAEVAPAEVSFPGNFAFFYSCIL